MIKTRMVATLLSLIVCATSYSFTVTQSFDFGPSTPNYTAGPFDVNQFDPSTGTLTSVSFSLSLDVEGGQLVVDNDGATGGSLTGVEIGAQGSLVSPDVNLLDNGFNPIASTVTASTVGNFTLAADDGDGPNNVDVSLPDGDMLPGLNQTAAQSGTLNTLFWPSVTGTGTFPLSVDVRQVSNFGAGLSGLEGSFSPVSSGGTITVTYEVVPEPMAAGLGLIGAVLLFVTRRRSK